MEGAGQEVSYTSSRSKESIYYIHGLWKKKRKGSKQHFILGSMLSLYAILHWSKDMYVCLTRIKFLFIDRESCVICI